MQFFIRSEFFDMVYKSTVVIVYKSRVGLSSTFIKSRTSVSVLRSLLPRRGLLLNVSGKNMNNYMQLCTVSTVICIVRIDF